VVFGSRKLLTVFHKSLNPEPALMMNMRFRVCKKIRFDHKIGIPTPNIGWKDLKEAS